MAHSWRLAALAELGQANRNLNNLCEDPVNFLWSDCLGEPIASCLDVQ
jgi:hypothetical protein